MASQNSPGRPTLPALPNLSRQGHSRPVRLLLQRCTRHRLLEADVEASDLALDKWVTRSIWDGYPPSHRRHPWHSQFIGAREEALWNAPSAVDYQAERAAAKGRKP